MECVRTYYEQKLKLMTRAEIVEERKELLKMLNGDVFFKIALWPRWVERAFWRKPISDSDTFKLAIFFIGNGCPPWLISKWIMTSQEWSHTDKEEKGVKRARQLQFIMNNLGHKAHQWFYYDLLLKGTIRLDGTRHE